MYNWQQMLKDAHKKAFKLARAFNKKSKREGCKTRILPTIINSECLNGIQAELLDAFNAASAESQS